MNILGLDPANNCGFAHSTGIHGVWNLSQKSDKHPGRRLERLRRHLFLFKRHYEVDLIAIEDASFGSHNPGTQAMHNELRGIVKLCAAEWEINLLSWTPSHLKKWLTGNGRANKEQIIESVSSRFGVLTRDDNIADAIMVMERAKFELDKPNGEPTCRRKVKPVTQQLPF